MQQALHKAILQKTRGLFEDIASLDIKRANRGFQYA